MAFKVKRFEGAPDYEALHVAKLTCFPLERRDYKPYSQARVCFDGGGALHLQLLSFEAEPLPGSAMRAVFRLEPGCPALLCGLNALGEFSVRCDGEPVLEAAAHYFTGEDLQGVYWGGNLTVPAPALGRLFPGFSPNPGNAFSGNLYKLCEDPGRPHYGCFYPADFQKPLDAPENLGEFTIIDY